MYGTLSIHQFPLLTHPCLAPFTSGRMHAIILPPHHLIHNGDQGNSQGSAKALIDTIGHAHKQHTPIPLPLPLPLPLPVPVPVPVPLPTHRGP